MLTSMTGQLVFSYPDAGNSASQPNRISEVSLHRVSDVKLGRWRKLDNETDTRDMTVTYDDGRKFTLTLFRDRPNTAPSK